MTIIDTGFRPKLHYLLALLLISVYGTQVCPFVESLSSIQIAIPLIAVITLQFLLRHWLSPLILDHIDYKHQVKRTFQFEWLLFLGAGVALAIINTVLFDAPFDSDLKIILGFCAIGFFVSIDLALEKEIRLAKHLEHEGITVTPDSDYFPLVGKFALFATISTLIIVGVFFLLINKDLDWLTRVGNEIPLRDAQRSIVLEFSFVGVIMLGYMLSVILSYARNLKHFLNNENHILSLATAGNLNTSVSVCTNDEFGEMAYHTNVMISSLLHKTKELQKTRDVTIMSLASLAETRDNETGAHILRTQRYVRALANAVQRHPRFKSELTDENIDLLFKSAPLHDIGKVGIPDRILLKPGKLDDEEFRIMKTHAALGSDALKLAEEQLGSTSFLRYAREIALTHHEKWDGSGYPNGLCGEEIPISGRLMAIADVYDALISKRVYKPAFTHEKAMEILKEGRNSHFDPDLIDALLEIEHEFVEIAKEYADHT